MCQSIDRHGLVVFFFTLYCLFCINSTSIGHTGLPTERTFFGRGTRPASIGDSTQKMKPSTLVIKVFDSNITTPLTSATAVITSILTGKVERFTLPAGQLYCTFTKVDQLSIDISAPGYTSVNRKMTIPVSPQGNRYEFDAVLDKTTIGLTVLAVDRKTGNIIPDVRFTISGKMMGNNSITLTADPATGSSKVELPGKGNYSLSSTANGYDSFVKSIRLDSVQSEARVILTQKQLPTGVKPVAKSPSASENPVVQPVAKVAVAVPKAVTEKITPLPVSSPLKKPEKGILIRLPNVYFDQSSPVLRPESYAELNQLYDALTENPALQIEIRGHTDNQGDFDLNVKLSRDRCQAIVDYLANKGIAKNRLKAVGRGPIDPIAPNNNEENRKKNRRVEFVVI
jgi:OOP family OmpA-OmpF porin